MNKKLIALFASSILVFPVAALAQILPVPGQITVSLPFLVQGLVLVALNVLWSIAILVVVVMFTIAGFKFLTAQGDPSKVNEARQATIWGLVGATVIIVAWSVITIVRLQLGV